MTPYEDVKVGLVALREEVDSLCDDAFAEHHASGGDTFRGDAINWGDLGCVSAEFWVDDATHTGYRVYIEEAAPDGCPLLVGWIETKLGERGFTDIEVVTEW